MSKIKDALDILRSFNLPQAQCNERSALVLLALAAIPPEGKWNEAKRPLLRVWDIMGFIRDVYKKNYAANTRETIRRQTIHQFEQARLVDKNPDNPKRPTNSGKTVYALANDALLVLKKHGKPSFNRAIKQFIKKYDSLDLAYRQNRELLCIPLQLPGGKVAKLSPGNHNRLQVAIIEEMGPRFAPGADILYLGDTAKKHVVCKMDILNKLCFPITEHDKLPDVVLYQDQRNWLFLVEAVTSHGPVSPKRHRELETLLSSCLSNRIYVSAFLTRNDFRKYAADIAWETEVWIAEDPTHMIHYNGPKFLGPCESIPNDRV
jgi:hypothetical protein